ncbi:glycosyltransferase [Streptomyces griseorubiginosus]|uniref:glycosyltransferase n=1 Tax=Streptomyces griseorubiginosus TaxID=67304 RepID=UPI002E809E83|nr:glycosyltransferase [Streptomyces griseorubiginosus]WUB42279.1 glycosyltransferase [Streptomyces griseorubiginosus]WUB50798.1 glycosyltransferase [Streptomyces griseorubiginosus]
MTAGSRGDVAPFTGLGHGLARAGHEVTLVTHSRFAPLAARAGLGFHALPVDPRAELESSRGRALHRSTTGVGKLVRVVAMARTLAVEMADELVTAARGGDALLLSGSVAPLGHAVAEGLGLPSLGLNLQPLAATREFAPPMLGIGSWGALGNRVAGIGLNLAVEQVFAAALPPVRSHLGLPPMGTAAALRARDRQGWPVLHGFSPRVVARPRDWRRGLEVAGYWWPYDGDEPLPDEVRKFVDAGPPPVFVGLGSATVPDPARVSAEIVRALRRAGLRGVIQRGWAGLAATGDDMLTIDEVPHSALFPHMAAVVHHAGAGTTAAGLRAGVPAVPVPIQFDESFWAARLVALGVAPSALPLRRLTAATLATALTRATRDAECRARAQVLGRHIREEDGVAPVVEAVNALRR